MIHQRLGEILVQKGLISRAQLEECLKEQKATGEYLGALLLKKDLIGEADLLKVLSQQYDISYGSLKTHYVDWNVCLRFAPVILTQRKALPLREDETSVTVAISNPLDAITVSQIEERAWPKKLKLVLVSAAELDEYINECKKKTRGRIEDILKKDDNAQ